MLKGSRHKTFGFITNVVAVEVDSLDFHMQGPFDRGIHFGEPLFQGTLSGATVTCPWHRWRFDLRTGERLHPPREEVPDGCSIDCYEVTWSERRTIVLRRR